jgi:hypothetical protein
MSGREAFEVLAALPLQVAELVAVSEDGATAMVFDSAQPGEPARAARTLTDLRAGHIGAQVALMFEAGDATRPIVIGVLRGSAIERPRALEVEADGERMTVSAKQQLVLRCGKASITLTKAGKVLIEGSYVASRSTGVNRIKGGSVQLN